MKKRSRIVSLGVLALTLTMMSTCLMGATMARYVTEVTGSATAKVAAWSFKANGETSTLTAIDLGADGKRNAYNGTDVAAEVIAPGTSGKFDIAIDGTGSEVGIDYVVNIASASGTTLPSDMTFKVDNAAYTLGEKIEGTIDYSNAANSMKKTITVNWEWPFDETDNKESNDNAYADNDWTLAITITGKQTTPETTAATP
ncbi:hypothetical protein [Enterocloster lavalensis]|uniref:hypothetical protein n=1 Tax=Enterocloster lavalensis TaxID=460384 RepID=UPI002665C356|nr:hypothetical protein [Enterocloster lavalensis]